MIWGSARFGAAPHPAAEGWGAPSAASPRRGDSRTIGAGAGRAETISSALIEAYLANTDINTPRAAVRAADEGVPEANAGYLPTITAQGNVGIERAQTTGLIGPDNSVSGTRRTRYFRGATE